MFGGDQLTFFCSGGDEGASGEVIGSAEEASGSLMDSGDGLFGEEGLFHPGDVQVVVEVALHILAVHPFEVGPSDHPGREGQRSSVEEFVQEVTLPGEDDGQQGFGVPLELGEGVEFHEDFQSKQRGLIDDQGDFLFFPFYGVLDLGLNDAGHDGSGVASGFHFQGPAELAVEFQDGAARGGHPQEAPFGGVEVAGGKAQGGGFSRAHLSGDDGERSEA